MKKLFSLILIIGLMIFAPSSFATFTIVAVDPATGQVGSAGASCIDNNGCGGCGGVIIATDLVPGTGAICAQATVCIPNTNLQNAINWMKQGNTPAQIITLLQQQDACGAGNVTTRQYGIAAFDSQGNVLVAGHTGTGCTSYANDKQGMEYSVQGNILIGAYILDSMAARFERATGSLACRLMYAIQGANVAGADSRCLNEGVSSQSAFLRVANSNDPDGNFFIDINVPSTSFGAEPIDQLQSQFDAIVNCTVGIDVASRQEEADIVVFPNPSSGDIQFSKPESIKTARVELLDLQGKVMLSFDTDEEKVRLETTGLARGIYILKVSSDEVVIQKKIVLN